MSMPLTSVIVPAYNAAGYIRACIASILDQGGAPLEIIVVDDGSSDDTVAIVEAMPGPVRCLRQANAGSAVARNHGVDASRGDFIAFCDSDDLWAPGRLQQHVDFLLGDNTFGAACGRFVPVEAGFSLDQLPTTLLDGPATVDATMSGWMYLELLRDSIFHLDALLARRDVAQRLRFDPRYRRGQDFDYFLQLANATRIAQLDGVYAYYRQHEESITRQPHLRNYRAEITTAGVARYGLADADGERMPQAELRRLLAKSWFSHGWALFHAHWYTKAHEAFTRCLRLQPTHLGALRYAAKSLLKRGADRMPADARPL